MFEKMMAAGILSGFVTGDVGVAIIVALITGIVSAAVQYNTARRDEEMLFDAIDFIIAVISSSLAGTLGYFGAGAFIDDSNVLLFIVGMCAIAGFQGLTTVKEGFIEYITHRLLPHKAKQKAESKQPPRRRDSNRHNDMDIEYRPRPDDDKWMDE